MTLQSTEVETGAGPPEGFFYRGLVLACLVVVPCWALLLGVARLLI